MCYWYFRKPNKKLEGKDGEFYKGSMKSRLNDSDIEIYSTIYVLGSTLKSFILVTLW